MLIHEADHGVALCDDQGQCRNAPIFVSRHFVGLIDASAVLEDVSVKFECVQRTTQLGHLLARDIYAQG